MLRPGDSAPDFAVGGETLHAMLRRGTVVVYFFPKAFTPGWTSESGEFRRRYEELQRQGVSVVGVSTDPPEVAERFRRELDLPFHLVGDPRGTVARAYRARWPVVGWARRTTYVVGRDGTIVDAFRSEGRPLEHVARACAAVSERRPG